MTAGWVALVADYRLDSPTPYVTEPADVRAAVEWLQRNAARYGVDPARIALVGSSAGGQLAALEATTGTGPPGAPGRVKAVVSWSGPMDLTRLAHDAGCADGAACTAGARWVAARVQRFEGGCPVADCPDRWADTSPVRHVDPTDPPMLLVNSREEIIPLDQLQEMAATLSAAGVPVTTDVLDGDRHALAYHDTAWPTTVAFLTSTV